MLASGIGCAGRRRGGGLRLLLSFAGKLDQALDLDQVGVLELSHERVVRLCGCDRVGAGPEPVDQMSR